MRKKAETIETINACLKTLLFIKNNIAYKFSQVIFGKLHINKFH